MKEIMYLPNPFAMKRFSSPGAVERLKNRDDLFTYHQGRGNIERKKERKKERKNYWMCKIQKEKKEKGLKERKNEARKKETKKETKKERVKKERKKERKNYWMSKI